MDTHNGGQSADADWLTVSQSRPYRQVNQGLDHRSINALGISSNPIFQFLEGVQRQGDVHALSVEHRRTLGDFPPAGQSSQPVGNLWNAQSLTSMRHP